MNRSPAPSLLIRTWRLFAARPRLLAAVCTGLLHCVLAFFFNTTVLALAINIAAGLV